MRLIIILLLIFFCQIAFADLVVTSEDVEIRFPDAADPDGSWYAIAIEQISYLQEPVGTHIPRTKLGPQVWEGLLQADQPELGKVRFTITILALPNVAEGNKPARRMDLQFRVREVIEGVVHWIVPFSEFNFIDIIGKPGKPVHLGSAAPGESVESALFQNYPNFFNAGTWIPYQLAKDTDVVIEIYDSLGRLVRSLDVGYRIAGYYIAKHQAVYWDGKNEAGEQMPSGVYFYIIEADSFTAMSKMAMVR